MLEEAAQLPIVCEDDCPETTPAMAEVFRRVAVERDRLQAQITS